MDEVRKGFVVLGFLRDSCWHPKSGCAPAVRYSNRTTVSSK